MNIDMHIVDGLRASIARKSLAEFTYQAWHLIEPSTELKWNWHLDEICNALESVTAGNIKRLIINVPPGTMKSILVSVMFNAWEWTNDPSRRHLNFSYSDKNTIRDSRRLRTIVQSDWYRNNFGVELASDQWAKVRFDTTAKGWRIASSVGGIGTGEHPDIINMDDLIKAGDARSLVVLDTCKDFLTDTIPTRIARNPAQILIMQRLHMEDPSGFLMSRGGWQTICFPMRYSASRKGDTDQRPIPDPRDQRTTEGELLWPEMYPEEKVALEEIELGEYSTAGQLDQNPIPEGGAEFKRTYFKIVDTAPNELFIVRGYDAGGGESGNDRSSGTKLGEEFGTNDIYVLDSIVGNYGDRDYDNLIKQTAKLDGKKVLIREEREPGSSGRTVTKAHARMLRGYDYAEVIVSKDKVTRRRPFRAQAQAGNVYLLKGLWNEQYIQAMCLLPFGKHDDEGDSTSCAYNAIVADKKPKRNIVPKRGHMSK